MHGSRRELDVDLYAVEGAVPAGLAGHLFVLAPVPWGDGSPVFNGDAMAIRVDFDRQSARLKSRLLRDPSQRLDEQTRERPVRRFRNRHIARISPVYGVRNELNTAWLTMPTSGRLFATYDAGRPWEVDPVTLEVLAPVGSRDEWKQAFAIDLPWRFPPILTGAHPAHDDRTGDTYFANYSLGAVVAGAHVRLLHWTGHGPLRASRILDERGSDLRVQSLHQLAITERWVVLADTAFRLELGRFLSPNHWPLSRQRPSTSFYFVERERIGRDAVVRAKRVVIPREAVHFIADYACGEGLVTLHVGHPCASDASETLRRSDRRWPSGERVPAVLEGLPPSPTDVGMLGRYEVDVRAGVVTTAALSSSDHTWGPALVTPASTRVLDRHEHLWWNTSGVQPETLVRRLVRAYARYPHRSVAIDDLGERPPSLLRLDATTGAIAECYAVPHGVQLNSPQFIPHAFSTSALDGYIVCSAVGAGARRASRGDELWVFDAGHVAKGPVCKLGHPELDFALTLHTTWLPQRRGPQLAARQADFRP
jgi:carotenoid cleavage dioxygenase-like enzyme